MPDHQDASQGDPVPGRAHRPRRDRRARRGRFGRPEPRGAPGRRARAGTTAMRRRILLYKNGETDPKLVPDIGDYEVWFGRVLGEGCSLEVHRAFERPRHRLSGYDGILLTGSPRSLVDPEPWMN